MINKLEWKSRIRQLGTLKYFSKTDAAVDTLRSERKKRRRVKYDREKPWLTFGFIHDFTSHKYIRVPKTSRVKNKSSTRIKPRILQKEEYRFDTPHLPMEIRKSLCFYFTSRHYNEIM